MSTEGNDRAELDDDPAPVGALDPPGVSAIGAAADTTETDQDGGGPEVPTALVGTHRPVPHLSHSDPGVGLWIGLALGAPILGWGLKGLFEVSGRVEPAELGRWILGSALVHDALVIPLVLIIGSVARRVVPPVAWAPVRWAMATSAIAALIAWPFVRGYGRTPRVPSLLDRDYGAGLLWLILVVWALAGCWTVVRMTHLTRVSRPSDPA